MDDLAQISEIVCNRKDLIKLHTVSSIGLINDLIIDKTIESLENNECGYSSSKGLLELRNKLAESHNIDSNDIVVSSGSRLLLYGIIETIVKPSDEVLIFDPEWAHFIIPKIKEKGAVIKRIKWPLCKKPDLLTEELSKSFTDSTKLIILSNPNNPTGRIIPDEIMDRIIDLSKKHGCYIVIDMAYSDLSFKKIYDHSEYNKTILLKTFSKMYSMSGFRVGYTVCRDKKLNELLTEFCYNTIQCLPIFTQKGVMKALEIKDLIKKRVMNTYKKKIELAKQKLKEHNVRFVKPDSAPFICIPLKEGGAKEFSYFLLDNGVAVCPSTAFTDDDDFIRISLATSDNEITKGLDLIGKAFNNRLIPKQKSIIDKALKEHNHKAYHTNLFSSLGLNDFYVGEGILRPDKSWASYLLSQFLHKNFTLYSNKDVLDMGCGSGIQTIIAAMSGAKRVTAADVEEYSIYSTKINIKEKNLSNKIVTIKSDLFNNVGGKFDVIIFNHPFFNYEPKNHIERIIFSGKDLLKRFFKEVNDHIEKDSILIMPFSHLAGTANNPKLLADKFGFEIIKEENHENELGRHSIYVMRKLK